MSVEVKVPVLPESVSDATVVNWHKNVGDSVARDETLVDLETDKVVLEVPAPADGVISDILCETGKTVMANDLLAKITEGAVSEAPKVVEASAEEKAPEQHADDASPAVRRLLAEHQLEANQIKGSAKGGRLVKQDVLDFIAKGDSSKPAAASAAKAPAQPSTPGVREEKRVPMTRLRQKIAERLVEAQHNAAMLTTFNEVNLKAVMDLRKQYKTEFEKKHGVRLGFMSFFTKAVVEALKRFPSVNASIDGTDVVYHGYFDVGIAVSTERGLVVPVLRDVDKMSMAGVEQSINDCASRARDGKLALEEMQGGTFTITNGGVFGSLLATPILNPPQTGILGMHKIEERPVVENGEIVIRPMMYVALSYDHRLIDGKESVQFLVTVKSLLEDPTRLLLDV